MPIAQEVRERFRAVEADLLRAEVADRNHRMILQILSDSRQIVNHANPAVRARPQGRFRTTAIVAEN